MPDGMNITTRIITPGLYDMPSDTYHADPCDTPSLSAGMITNLLDAPAKCRENSSRLNPDYEEGEPPVKFTIGTVKHVMFLEPELFEQKIAIVSAKTKDGKPSDSWATQDAKDQRSAAYRAGKTPVLEKNIGEIYAARKAFYANEFAAKAFLGGKTEQSMFWRHPTYGFWCRARPDFLHDTRSHMNDYKATATANPAQFGKHAYAMGYHRRAAWYLEGAQILFGVKPAHYWFVNQENDSPYLTTVVELDHNSIEAGQQENDRAAKIFARCLEAGEWPGYRHADEPNRDLAFQVGIPNWAYIQMDERNY
jgi:hypothetical protein